jgi:signal transduction histidine kinase
MIDNPCEWAASTLLIFSENVGALVYYTHIFPLVISLFLGFQILINDPKGRSNRVLFLLTLVFSVWVYFDLILWASPTPEAVVFFWSAIVPVEMFMYLLATYLVYLFAHEQVDAPTWKKALFCSLLVPIFLFAHTSLNVIGLSPDCDTGAFEGILIQYMYAAEIVLIGFVAYYLVKGIKHIKDKTKRQRHILISTATLIFLAFFSAGNLTLSFDLGPFYEQYKLFGMPLFGAIVAYSIIKLQTFRVKAVLAGVLISTLWILIFSMLLFKDMSYARPIIIITLIAFGLIGSQLTQSVRKEIEQREQIQKLAGNLEKANVRLQALDKQKSEFVSIASHQLRSPLTAIRGYASLLLEGSFGTIPQKAQEPLERIDESSKLMALAIEDYLNVSRIESGNMKYNLADFNLPNEVEHVTDDLRADALKKGLVLYFKKSLHNQGIIHADIGKTVQIIHNLINNSIKYTPAGTITVLVRDDMSKKKIFVDIIDTGIGMNQETLHTIFQKFERAKNANTVNTSGTGLGLFVADKMAEAMGGDISAHSEGDGKGSRFTLEMPLAM